jgi:hypothetical protein
MSSSNLDFNLLKGVPLPEPGKQVAQMQYIPQSPLGQFASGLAGGLEKGQQMAVERQKAAIMQQQANIQSQLAPSQIAMTQAQAQQTQMQTQMMQQQIARQSVLAGIANGTMPNQQVPAPQMASPQPQGTPIAPQGIPQSQPPINPQGQVGMAPPVNQPIIAPQQMQQQPQVNPVQQSAGGADHTGYNNAVVDYYYKIGRPDLAQAFLKAQNDLVQSTIKTEKDRQDMTKEEAAIKFDHFTKAGTLAGQLVALPDQEAVTQYNGAKGDVIRNIDDNAPKAGSDPQHILAYVHGADAVYKAESTKHTETSTTNINENLEHAQAYQDKMLDNYNTTLKQFGEKDSRTLAAKSALQAAQLEVAKISNTGGLINAVRGAQILGGNITPSSTTNSPAQNRPGKVWTYNPSTGKLE